MNIVTFFNNKGGVDKTSLVYHLAWMYADLGLSVLAADLDPQANLTSMFLDEDRLAELWEDPAAGGQTVFQALRPLLEGTGDIADPHVERVGGESGLPELGLLVGDLALTSAEDELSSQWPACLDRKVRAFRVLSAFWRLLVRAAQQTDAQLVLVDVGPNLGALNRAVLVAAEYVVIPLAPDLYSLQGLKNLGPALRRWRAEWKERHERNPAGDLEIPRGQMQPAGYVVLQHAVRLDRPVRAYLRWMERIPGTYQDAVLNEQVRGNLTIEDDVHCLGTLKHYRSLMPLAQEARKPMFFLKPADGAIGGHTAAVQACYSDFKKLALSIARRCGFDVP